MDGPEHMLFLRHATSEYLASGIGALTAAFAAHEMVRDLASSRESAWARKDPPQ